MCRLYGMQATHPTQIHCELLHVQNSLFHQAREDEQGFENPHGWGIGVVEDGKVRCKRQSDPAHESEKYRSASFRAYAKTAVAHVRRATVGKPRIENTHPFRTTNSFLAHNGHVDSFDKVGPKIREYLPKRRRKSIRGSTDSEHFFKLVLTEYEDHSAPSMKEALQRATALLRGWIRETDSKGEGGLGLNILWVHDGKLAGTKLDRPLWYRQRTASTECENCGDFHANAGDDSYRSIELASEKLTINGWTRVPDASVFWIDDDLSIHFEPLAEP